MCIAGRLRTCGGFHLELIECTINHALDEAIYMELRELVPEYCSWREHPSRPNVYVSDTGLVAKYQHGRVVLKKQNLINSGYLVVSVGDLGTKRNLNPNVLVHRLVAETFIENDTPEEKRYVNHIDGIKTNNVRDNLEWCSFSENVQHGYNTGIHKTEKVRIVETGEVFRSASECARQIGGTVSGIHDCKSGRQKMHRGYHFEFVGDEYGR